MARKAFGLTFNQCAVLLFLVVLGVGYLLPSKDEEPIATQSLDERQNPKPETPVVEVSPEPEPKPNKINYTLLEEKHAPYIAAVNRNLVKYNVSASTVPDNLKLKAGWDLCRALDEGQTVKKYVQERFDPTQMTTEERAGAVVVASSTADAAIRVYCPTHLDQLEQQEKS